MQVTYYEISTGKIVGASICSEKEAIDNIPDHCKMIEGFFDGSEFYIENENPVQIPEKPGDYYEFDFVDKQWVNIKTEDIEATLARDKRNLLLRQSDWTQMPDVVLSNKDEWAVYRQELRDITSQPGFPNDIIWPIAPEGV